jgi:hypothetical protein
MMTSSNDKNSGGDSRVAPSKKTKTKKKNETKLKKDEWMIDWEKVRAKKRHL